MGQYDYMAPEHAAEAEATEREIGKLLNEQPDLKGDALLNLASERAGYDPGESGVEICDHCGSIYHHDYGGEYVDPNDDQDLASELGIPTEKLLELKHNHYCGFDCLRMAVQQERENVLASATLTPSGRPCEALGGCDKSGVIPVYGYSGGSPAFWLCDDHAADRERNIGMMLNGE
jgi:hypothetical protein